MDPCHADIDEQRQRIELTRAEDLLQRVFVAAADRQH